MMENWKNGFEKLQFWVNGKNRFDDKI